MPRYLLLQELGRSRAARLHPLLVLIVATCLTTVVPLSASLSASTGRHVQVGVGGFSPPPTSQAPVAALLYQKCLLFRHVHPGEIMAKDRLKMIRVSSRDSCSPKQLKAAVPKDRIGVFRLRGFSLLLNPDAATTEQQLEKM